MRTRRGIVIIAPASYSCGSYEVFKGQVEAFRTLGYATYFLAVSRKIEAWKNPCQYWNHYLEMTSDIGADRRGEARCPDGLFTTKALWSDVMPALFASSITWKAFAAMLALLPANLHSFIDGCDGVDVVCNKYFNIPLAERTRSYAPGARIILETHDIQSRQLEDRRLVHPITRRVQKYEAMLAEELAYLRRADILIHLNQDEAAEFAKLMPNHRHEVVFPMIRHPASGADRNSAVEPFDFLIVMSDYHSNYTGLSWFFDKVWSPELDGNFNLKIVGGIDRSFRLRNGALYDRYKHRFLGRVPSVDPYYRAARTVLVPITQGHGISIKTVEAMSYGKPIIGTRQAFRGFDKIMAPGTIAGHADTPEAFRDQMLARAGRARIRDGSRALEVYQQLFSPEIYRRRYDAILVGEQAPRQPVSV
jgi:glycosyltransferase involved in cell wall biosynthesis